MKRSFLLLAATFALFIAAASAPSPLYSVFQSQWHFSTIILTVIFAMYAFALLASLLFFGSLSDYIGRRPVLLGALVIESVSMVMFAEARSVSWLIAARILQGLATGIATAVISAGLIDTEPKNRAGLASLLSTIVPIASLGVGALFTGLLVQYAIWPTHLVFWILCVSSIVIGLGVLMMPEAVIRKPGWQHTFMPTVLIPRAARESFIAGSCSLVASWTLVGLYLSLAPSMVAELTHGQDHVVGSLIILALTGSGAVSSTLLRSQADKRLIAFGTIIASFGLSMSIYSVTVLSVTGFFVGTIVTGVGFGPVLTGAFRSIMRHAPSDQRAGLAAAVYVVSYLALGIPTIVAGFAAVGFGLHLTFLLYGVGVIILYLLALALSKLLRQS